MSKDSKSPKPKSPKMTAGAGSGLGRLQKTAAAKKAK